MLSQVKQTVIRPMYSSPPLHGARIAAAVLGDAELNQAWRVELQAMSDRIQSMRSQLTAELTRIGAPGDWSHINQQIGMFAFTGLSAEVVDTLLLIVMAGCSIFGLLVAFSPWCADVDDDGDGGIC